MYGLIVQLNFNFKGKLQSHAHSKVQKKKTQPWRYDPSNKEEYSLAAFLWEFLEYGEEKAPHPNVIQRLARLSIKGHKHDMLPQTPSQKRIMTIAESSATLEFIN